MSGMIKGDFNKQATVSMLLVICVFAVLSCSIVFFPGKQLERVCIFLSCFKWESSH